MNKIILIGNGPSVLRHELGENIDKFDIVVRFNNFKIKGYEKNIGTKTNYWFTWCHFNVDNIKNLDKIYFHSWIKDKNTDKNYIKLKNMYNNIEIVDHGVLNEIKQHIPDYPHKAFSTGLIAAHIMIKKYSQIYLYGFDWWIDGLKHHYCDNADKGKLHKPKIEYKYFKMMEERGCCHFL